MNDQSSSREGARYIACLIYSIILSRPYGLVSLFMVIEANNNGKSLRLRRRQLLQFQKCSTAPSRIQPRGTGEGIAASMDSSNKQGCEQRLKIDKPKYNDIWARILVRSQLSPSSSQFSHTDTWS